MTTTSCFEWESYGMSDVGKIRKINEDAFLDLRKSGLWVVADGMGGHTAGDVASQMIVNSLAKLPPPGRLSSFINQIEDVILEVNRKLLRLADEKHEHQIVGSTVVGMVGFQNQCIYFWAGDSRLYRLREGNLVQLSRDHTEVEELVQQGLLLRENVANHPDKNTITRAIGADPNLYLEFDNREVYDGDIFLLCSDGLDKEVHEQEIQQILSQENLQAATAELISLTLDRGSRDNVTVITIKAHAKP